ncbi:hypothetical protein SUDANB151_00006 [Streptomyces sp. enrichment culture]
MRAHRVLVERALPHPAFVQAQRAGQGLAQGVGVARPAGMRRQQLLAAGLRGPFERRVDDVGAVQQPHGRGRGALLGAVHVLGRGQRVVDARHRVLLGQDGALQRAGEVVGGDVRRHRDPAVAGLGLAPHQAQLGQAVRDFVGREALRQRAAVTIQPALAQRHDVRLWTYARISAHLSPLLISADARQRKRHEAFDCVIPSLPARGFRPFARHAVRGGRAWCPFRRTERMEMQRDTVSVLLPCGVPAALAESDDDENWSAVPRRTGGRVNR